jgi:hypothetical protein
VRMNRELMAICAKYPPAICELWLQEYGYLRAVPMLLGLLAALKERGIRRLNAELAKFSGRAAYRADLNKQLAFREDLLFREVLR